VGVSREVAQLAGVAVAIDDDLTARFRGEVHEPNPAGRTLGRGAAGRHAEDDHHPQVEPHGTFFPPAQP
jgi:hypothetical protein